MKRPPQIHAAVDTTQARCFSREIIAGVDVTHYEPTRHMQQFRVPIPADLISTERLKSIEAMRGGKASALLFALAVLAEEVGE